jgi:hypothetical protein
MRFTAVIARRLLNPLGSKEQIEGTVQGVIETTLWLSLSPPYQEQNIHVEMCDRVTLDIDLELNQRDAETVKDIIHEALMIFFDPPYNSDVEVEINTEL